MSSLFGRLFARILKRKSQTRRSRREGNRRLRLEPMEMRRLLAGDLASITGTVYTDLVDNNIFDGSDPAIVATNVFLYKDGGNTTFDSNGGTAGGDDVLEATDATDGSGVFRFDNLDPGTYFVVQDAVSGRLQRANVTVQTFTITAIESTGVAIQNIDDFDTTPQTLQANSGTPSASGFVLTAGAEALGGERDIEVNHTAGGNNIDVTVNSGLLSVSTGAGTTGNAIISYDGIDSDATALNHTTLGGVNLTTSSANAFQFRAGSEAGNTMTMEIYSGAGNFSSVTVPIPITAGAVATEDMIIRFSDFTLAAGTGADFSNVTAIIMQIDMAAATDAQFDFTQVVAPFVETGNFPNLNPMSVGNLIFNDINNNSTLDSGELGIASVDVQLFSDTNLNGSYDDGIDTQVGITQTTDSSGNFLFSNLLPGEYILLVPASQFATVSDPLFGFASSGSNPAPDPDLTPVNNDDNGNSIIGVGVATLAFTLASGSEPTNDGDSDVDSDLSIDFGFAPQVDLQVTKSTGLVTSVIAGNQLTYTITVTNNGDAASTNVLVTDDLPNLSPDALTIVSVTSVSGNGVVTQTGNSTGEIEVAYATLASGATETITVVVGVPSAAAAAAAITNAVNVTGTGVDTNLANNDDSVDVAVTREAVLTLTKTDTPDPAAVGSALTYEIIVTNTGASTATNVVVSDTLPTGLTFVSVNTTAGTAAEASGVITVDIPTLAVNASATITVNATIAAAFAGSSIPNSATAIADEAILVTANASTTINPQVDLAITKSDSVDPVSRGSQLVYTLAIVNNGPSGATNVEVVDTLPAGVTFVSATGGTVTPPSGNTNVTVAVGSLASGATATVTITVDVLDAANSSFTNTAIVRSTESTNGFDTNTNNNTDSELTAAQSSIDLAITKSDSADPIIPGQTMSYTIVVTNNGPSSAASVVMTDNLPDGIRVTSATSTVGTVTIPASAQDTTAANTDDLTVAIGTLASGASATITVNATVLAATTGTLSNVATVASTDVSMIETNAGNNTATETTALTPTIDLRVTKTDGTDPTIAGNSLVYTIVVTNDGPSTATNVSLTDTLPSGVTFTSVTTSQGTASQASGVVTGTLGTLEPNASATLTLTVGVNPATRGSLTNTATVTATQTDSDSSNNSASAVTTINGSVDLSITKTDVSDPVAAGGTLSYTIIVTNNGPSTATGVIMTDTLPSSLTFSNGTSTVGTVTNVGNVVSVNIGTLAPSATATITVNTAVSSTATGTISNTATVDLVETDTNSANNSATQATTVAVPGSIAGVVYIDVDRNGVQGSGETGVAGVTITLTGTNLLGATVNQTQVTDVNGAYNFTSILPGTYTLTETQPAGLADGSTTVGTGATGTAGTNQITTIVLGSGANATGFNFGEIRSSLSKRRLLASSSATD